MANIASMVARIKCDPASVLKGSVVENICRELGYSWRQRELDPATTVGLFIQQIVHGNVPCSEVRHLGRGTGTQLEVEHFDQLIPSKVVMLRNAIQDGLECPDLERIVSRDGNVMLALNLRGQSHMRAGLPTLNVSELAQSLGESVLRMDGQSEA